MIPIAKEYGLEFREKAILFMGMFERLMDLLARKLGVPTEEGLSDRVQQLLAENQFEMAVIQYRKETGAELESAFFAVRNGGKLDMEARFQRILIELESRFPDLPSQ